MTTKTRRATTEELSARWVADVAAIGSGITSTPLRTISGSYGYHADVTYLDGRTLQVAITDRDELLAWLGDPAAKRALIGGPLVLAFNAYYADAIQRHGFWDANSTYDRAERVYRDAAGREMTARLSGREDWAATERETMIAQQAICVRARADQDRAARLATGETTRACPVPEKNRIAIAEATAG